jgi:hypothetical protein
MAVVLLVLLWIAYLAWLAVTDDATRQAHLVAGWALLLVTTVAGVVGLLL